MSMPRIFYENCIQPDALTRTVAKMTEPPEITVLEFNGTLLAAMRSPGLHELVAGHRPAKRQ
jgi:hypothetical protein